MPLKTVQFLTFELIFWRVILLQLLINQLLNRLKNYPEFNDGQVSKLVGSTKGTVSLIRKRSYWNFSNLKAKDPVILGLCSQDVFEKSLEKAKRRVEREKKAKVKAEKLKATQQVSTEQSS